MVERYDAPFSLLTNNPWLVPRLLDWPEIEVGDLALVGLNVTVRTTENGFLVEMPFHPPSENSNPSRLLLQLEFSIAPDTLVPEQVTRNILRGDDPANPITIWRNGYGELPDASLGPEPGASVWEPAVDPISPPPTGFPPETGSMEFSLSRAVEVARANHPEVDAYLRKHNDTFVHEAARRILSNATVGPELSREWRVVLHASDEGLNFTTTQPFQATLLPEEDSLYQVSDVERFPLEAPLLPNRLVPIAPLDQAFGACREALGSNPDPFTVQDAGLRAGFGGRPLGLAVYGCSAFGALGPGLNMLTGNWLGEIPGEDTDGEMRSHVASSALFTDASLTETNELE